jgi:ferredoxin-NADP reductase
MNAWTWMTVAGLGIAPLQAMAQELEAHKPSTQLSPLSLRLSDEVIGKAVRETLAEQAGGRAGARLHSQKALSGDAYRKFERAFSEAEKPDCLHPDAMKFQPHSLAFKIGGQTYGIGVGGQLAIPFWIAAIVRGKCN